VGWFEGLLGGFSDRKREVEIENIRQSDLASERESRVYNALLSSPDPEIQAMAASGLLESAQPKKRKGGLRGWIGEMDVSPTFQRLQQLVNTPEQKTSGTPGTLAHTEYPSIATPPPQLGDAPAGMAAQSLTQPGAEPPANVPAAPRAQPKAIPSSVGTPPTFGPRQIFPTAESQAIATARGKAQGDVEGEVAGLVAAGFEETEARDLIKQDYMRRGSTAGGLQAVAGEYTGPDGTTVPTYATFDRATGIFMEAGTKRPLPNFRRATTTGSVSMGADREAISMLPEFGGQRYTALTPNQRTKVDAEVRRRVGETAENRGLGAGRAKIAIELASPIGPAAAAQYNVAPTTTLQQLQNMVGLNDAQKDRVYALSQIDVTLDEIEALLPKVFPNVAPGMSGALKTALSLGTQRLAGDADLAALDAAIEGSLAQVAQLSGQPGSRLSDNDIKMARSELANLTPALFGGDTINTARARVGVLRKLFDRAQSSIPGIGTPPPGAPTPAAVSPAAGTPPPSRSNTAGPAGYYVNDAGDLIKR